MVESEYRVYGRRWGMLALASFANACSAIIWITFAPITSVAADYYDVSVRAIVGLSLVFLAFYVPASGLSSWLFESYGIRKGLIVGALLNLLSVAIRFASTKQGTDGSYNGAYAVLMIGQTLAAIAQPFFTNLPARFAAIWFGVEQRDIATTIFVSANLIGIAVGSILPTIFADVDNETVDMFSLLLVELGIVLVSSSLIVFLFREEPPTPPSKTAEEKRAAKNSLNLKESANQVWNDVKNAFSENNFTLIFVAAATGLGFFNSLTTLIETITKPAGYNTDDAGTFSIAFLGCGLVSAGIVGVIMDKTHKYITLLRILATVSTLATLGLCFSIRPNMLGAIAAFFGILGSFMIPLLPLAFELAAECTYPSVPEDISTGLIMSGGQVTGIGFLLGMEALIGKQPDFITADQFTYEFTPTYIIAVVAVVIFWIAALAFNGKYKRLQAEKTEKTTTIGNVDEL